MEDKSYLLNKERKYINSSLVKILILTKFNVNETIQFVMIVV